MKKKAIAISAAIAVLLAAVGFFAYRFTHDPNDFRVVLDLYFLNTNSSSIAPEEREIHFSRPEELPGAVVAELIAGPASSDEGIIPESTELLSLVSDGQGGLTVDFSSGFYSGDSSRDIMAVYSVIKSLCGINNIQRVQVTVNGEAVKAPDGSEIGFLTSDDINISTETASSDSRNVTLYFSDASGTTLLKEIRTVHVTDRQPLEQYIINELIKGPYDETALAGILSADTVVASVETTDGICFVNFRANFLDKNSSSAGGERLVIYSIVNSLTELADIQYVQFLFDGKKTDKFGSMDVSGLFTRDESLITQQ